MAEETRPDARGEQPDSGATNSPTAKKKPLLKRLWTLKCLAILLGMTVVMQGAAFLGYQLRDRAATRPGSEISLGEFRFEADGEALGRIDAADFALHIALLERVDRAARDRLDDRKYRLQQDIEQLLRRAHGGDFDDPALTELKRQLQEQINDTLGLRAIADVIVTDLVLQFSEPADAAPAAPTEATPWTEDPDALAAAPP